MGKEFYLDCLLPSLTTYWLGKIVRQIVKFPRRFFMLLCNKNNIMTYVYTYIYLQNLSCFFLFQIERNRLDNVWWIHGKFYFLVWFLSARRRCFKDQFFSIISSDIISRCLLVGRCCHLFHSDHAATTFARSWIKTIWQL